MKRRYQIWLEGIGQGLIHGAATAGSAWGGLSMVATMGVPVQVPDLRTLGWLLVCGSLSSTFAYLRQSPWATAEDDTTAVLIKTIAAPKI